MRVSGERLMFPKIIIGCNFRMKITQINYMERQNCHKAATMPPLSKPHICKHKLSTSIATVEQIIPLHRLTQHIQLFTWRKQHHKYLIGYQWTSIEPFSDKEVIMYLKQRQHLVSLQNIEKVRGNSIMKNVGKIFDGFKILFDKFGPFEVLPQMIAFDGSYDTFVWMNKDYSKNEYKRDYISQEQFAQSVLQILLRNEDKFDCSNFVSQCYIARTFNYKLAQMASYFEEAHEDEKDQESTSVQETASQKTIGLTFNKNKKPKKNVRRGSAYINQSVSSLGFCQQSRDLTELNTHHKMFKQQALTNESTTSPFSKGASKIASLTSEKVLDESFSFDGEQEKEDKRMACQLSVSVDLGSDKEGLEDRQIIVLPMLDKLQTCMVHSIINPTTN